MALAHDGELVAVLDLSEDGPRPGTNAPSVAGAAHSARVTTERSDRSTETASAREALEFADAIAQASSQALGDAPAGVALHGSLTLGDYLPGRSDIDLLVVVDDPLNHRQPAALAEAVGQERAEAPIRVDLRVVTRDVAAAPTPLLPMEAYLTIKKGREPSVHVDRRHPGERDLVVEFSACRAHGRSIRGAPPAGLIGEVPDEWVLDVGDAQLADWQAIGDDPPHAQLTVLTACRLWRFVEGGQHSSKDAAGEWAMRRDSRLEVVRDALRQRHADPTHPIDAAHVHDLLVLVRDRIAEARASA